ncbi:hypothetical protein [Nocardia vinacea]|uniref:hypothetical protein n=1 Tax=Nocardia vinacea TaxID=96468 RepID=UPI0012F6F8B3|nr:hypothetical protein [Nocardia vinacea]
MTSTCMGKQCYPAWLDNLADDVTGDGAAWAIQGAEAVHEVVLMLERFVGTPLAEHWETHLEERA